MEQKKLQDIFKAQVDAVKSVKEETEKAAKAIASVVEKIPNPAPAPAQTPPETAGSGVETVKVPSYATPTAINRADAQAVTRQAPAYATPTQINRADAQMTMPPLPKPGTAVTPTQVNRMDAEAVYQDLLADRDKVATVATHYQTGAGDMGTILDSLAELQDKYGVTGSDFAAYANGDQEGAVRQLYDRLPTPRKDGPGFWSRLGDMVSGAGKASGAAFTNTLTDLYRGGQGGRDRENLEWLEQYRRDLDRAERDLAQAKELEEKEPGKWTKDVEVCQNIVDFCQLKYDAMAKVVGEDVQKRATAAAHGWADDIQASAQEDLERAKKGLGKFGQVAVDAGATTVQSGIDFITNLALGLPAKTMFAFALRAYGSASQKARQDGADETGQTAYGVAVAVTELVTEKLFGLALPFYGKGTMDDAVKRGISKAVHKLAETEMGQRVLDGVLTLGAGAFGEGFEELIADWAEWQMPRIYGGDVASAEETAENSLYDFFVGTIAGMMGETVNPATYRYDTGSLVTSDETTPTTAVTPKAPSSVHHVLEIVRQANAEAEAKWKMPEWVPEPIRKEMKEWNSLNLTAAKRSALGNLLGFSPEFQKNIPIALDKVLADADDIARWESLNLPPEIWEIIQPQLEEKKESLQWLEDRLAKLTGDDDAAASGEHQNEIQHLGGEDPQMTLQDTQGETLETLAKRYGVEYTDTERYGLLERYHQSVTKGILSPLVDFPLYEDYYQKIQDRAIGQVVNGVKITQQSQHFLERVFGCMQDPGTKRPRNGVALEDLFDCLENPVKIEPTIIGKDGRPSFRVVGRRAKITINPETGKLIQINPRR